MINLDVPKFKLALDSILHVLEKLSEIQNFVGLISVYKNGADKEEYEVKSGIYFTFEYVFPLSLTPRFFKEFKNLFYLQNFDYLPCFE